MTDDMLRRQCDLGGKQLKNVFEGLSDEGFGFRCSPSMMTARDMANHLAECYVAAMVEAKGGKHEWGSFALEADSNTEAVSKMMGLREEAINVIIDSAEDKKEHLITDFFLLHDAYHVGQMVANRIAFDPEWNSYAIYN